MIKITERNDKLEELFKGNNKAFVFRSIIQGNTPGCIYVDNIEAPGCYVVFDRGNFTLFFGGETKRADGYRACIAFIKDEILNDEMKEEYEEWILLLYENEIWKEEIEKGLKGFRIEYDKRTLFNYPLDKEVDSNEEIHVLRIDEEILKNDSLENIGLLREEISDMWGDIENFSKNGFGTCTMEDGKITSYCTAEFISSEQCGIGIFTVEDYRNKGIARAIAAEFVREAKKRNITPYWDAWTLNVPSVKVAERAGFKRLEEYSVMALEL